MGCNTGTEHETVAEIDIAATFNIDIAATFNLRNITQETDHTSKEALISWIILRMYKTIGLKANWITEK